MSTILEALGLGAGSGVASAGIGYLANRSLAQEQQKYYQKNLAKQFAYSQLAQKMAPSNIKQGLVMAGMSPALATEGRFSPAQSPSAPLGSNSVGMPNVNVAESALAMAEANKAQAEADKTNIEVSNMEDANATARVNLEHYFVDKARDSMSHGDVKGSEFWMMFANDIGSVGGLDSLHRFLDLTDKGNKYDMNKWIYGVDKAKAFELLRDYNYNPSDSIIWDIVKMSTNEREKLVETVNLLRENVANAQKTGKLLDFDLQLDEQQLKNMEIVAKSIENRDLKQLWDKGDKAGFVLALFSMVLEAIAGGAGRLIPTSSRSHSTSESHNVNLNLH